MHPAAARLRGREKAIEKLLLLRQRGVDSAKDDPVPPMLSVRDEAQEYRRP